MNLLCAVCAGLCLFNEDGDALMCVAPLTGCGHGVGFCQRGLQGRADFSAGTVGEGATGRHPGAGRHSHKVSGWGLWCCYLQP